MTENEALILGRIAQGMREIKRLAGLLHEETAHELESAWSANRLMITTEDFFLLESITLNLTKDHGYAFIPSLVQEVLP